MKPAVVVVDYGLGNLLSVTRALEHCGAAVELSSDPSVVEAADRLVLPGVGSFGDGMAKLRERGLVDPLRRRAASDRPFLGICLGMQLMFESSSEFGRHEGLGLLPGAVVELPRQGLDGRPLKIPHMGWSALLPVRPWAGTIMGNLKEGAFVYFVHSFIAQPAREADRLAAGLHGGARFTAAVASGRMYGCQFHPEKSGEVGLGILAGFCALPK